MPSSEAFAKRYEALLRLSASFPSRTPEDLAWNLVGELRTVLNFDFLDVLVYKEGSREVLWRALGEGHTSEHDVPMEETPAWWVYQNQQRLSIPDWDRDDRFPSLKTALNVRGIEARSICVLPLTTPHVRLGAIAIASRQPLAYSDEEVRFLSMLADGLALAIGNVFCYEASCRAQAELVQQNARLKLLLDLTGQIMSNLDLRELLRAISASVRHVIDCGAVGVSLLDAESGKIHLAALDFPDGKGFIHEDQSFTPGEGAVSRALETRKPVIVNHFDPADYSPELYQKIVGEGIQSQCFIPLVNRGHALGLLGLCQLTENSFSEEDAEFLGQVAGQIAIAVDNALAYREITQLKDKLTQEKLYLEKEIRSELNFEQIIGKSPTLRHVLELVETVAPNDSTVLLLGETGTGKELIARAIHDHSRRKDRTFVRLNCAAIPAGLLESELFGHERGAFTGAIRQKLGRLELADQGTLFLDEVGDIPLEIQSKLLRVLQEREFERLGSTHTRKVNVRLVAATNRNLEVMIASRQFRSDLYYRLNVFPIHIPPLRQRREDIPLLVRYFVQKFARQMQKPIENVPAAALKKLSAWDWPGNVRELENFVERAVILTRGKTLEIPLAEGNAITINPSVDSHVSVEDEEIVRIVRATLGELHKETVNSAAHAQDEKQRQVITRILQETKGRVGGVDGAAAHLGVHRTTLLSRMKKLGIDPKQFC
ncbi:MAG: sigma 54-interacting transcriptional regulator [Acidobacteriaceae bacterium]